MYAPAYGWVDRLEFADGVLKAVPRQVDPAFSEIVKAGRFKKVSACFWGAAARGNPRPGGLYLRHVGFLGAAAPAVQGLRPVSFADDGSDILSFGDEFAELADRERIVAERESMLRFAETRSFVEKMVDEGRVLPREQDGLVAFMAELDNNGVIEFSEAGSATKTTLGRLDWLKRMIAQRPSLVPFGEAAPASLDRGVMEFSAPDGFTVDPTGVEMRDKALAYQRKHGVSFEQAVRTVATTR